MLPLSPKISSLSQDALRTRQVAEKSQPAVIYALLDPRSERNILKAI